jgi:two-component system response regulator
MDIAINPRLVLLVEDNADDERLALRALKGVDGVQQVQVCRDGAEALDFLFCRGEYDGNRQLPGLVLLDLKLPRVSGLEVLQELRSSDVTRKLPVVLLSSSTEKTDVSNAYKLGANSYIAKPIEFEKFLDMVKLLANYWLNTNRSPA